MNLYYHHQERKIVDENDKEYSYDEALHAFREDLVDDFNTAFNTLMEFDGDMDRVDDYYQAACGKYA